LHGIDYNRYVVYSKSKISSYLSGFISYINANQTINFLKGIDKRMSINSFSIGNHMLWKFVNIIFCRRDRIKTKDVIYGLILGIGVVVVVGKLWIFPGMSIWEIVKVVGREVVGW